MQIVIKLFRGEISIKTLSKFREIYKIDVETKQQEHKTVRKYLLLIDN